MAIVGAGIAGLHVETDGAAPGDVKITGPPVLLCKASAGAALISPLIVPARHGELLPDTIPLPQGRAETRGDALSLDCGDSTLAGIDAEKALCTIGETTVGVPAGGTTVGVRANVTGVRKGISGVPAGGTTVGVPANGTGVMQPRRDETEGETGVRLQNRGMTTTFAPGDPPPIGTCRERPRLTYGDTHDCILLMDLVIDGDSIVDGRLGCASVEELRIVGVGNIAAYGPAPTSGGTGVADCKGA